jgi:hypothetical protein
MILPTINRDILAARVGTTRSRINFFMNKFRKRLHCADDGGLKVHTSLLNVIVRLVPPWRHVCLLNSVA